LGDIEKYRAGTQQTAMRTGMRNTGMQCQTRTRKQELYYRQRYILGSVLDDTQVLSMELGSRNLRSHGEAVNVMLWGFVEFQVELGARVMKGGVTRFQN